MIHVHLFTALADEGLILGYMWFQDQTLSGNREDWFERVRPEVEWVCESVPGEQIWVMIAELSASNGTM